MANSDNSGNLIDSVLIVKSCEKTTAEILEDLEQAKNKEKKSINELIKESDK